MAKNSNKNKDYKDFLKKRSDFASKIKKSSVKERKILLKDSDNDGLSDYEEKNIYGTDPHNSDTDGDGMNDGKEIKKGRNPLGKGTLKDLFIPHKGNKYQPKSLSTKRLVFHGVGAVIVKMIVVSLLFSFPVTAWMTPDILKKESKDIIKLTNETRVTLSLNELSEIEKLNQAAFEKAQNMLLKQYFAHTDKEGRGLEYWIQKVDYSYSMAGENLAMGFTTAKKTVDAWIASPTHYANIKDKNFQEIGVAMVSGPYSGIETNLAVQYFARPKKTNQQIVNNTANIVKMPEISQKAEIKIVKTPEKEVKVLSVKAELPENTEKAIVQIKEKEIELEKTSEKIWQAEEIIYETEEKEIKNPIIPATIVIEDGTGITKTAEVPWQNIEPKEITKIDQYQVYRENSSGLMTIISKISSWYFMILFGLALMALLLSMLIEIKKQHPHLIIRSLLFICLLIVFIIF